jgi:hypothetical protein
MAYVSIQGRTPNKFQLSRYARTVRKAAGMGQTDNTVTSDDGGFVNTQLPIIALGDQSPFSGIGVTATSPTPVPTSTSTPSTPTLSGSDFLSSLGINISGVDPTALPGAVSAASSPSSGGGFNLSSFLNSLTGDAAAATKIYQQLQGPSLVAGTNAIYNPATGQYYNPTTGQVVEASGLSTANFSQLSAMLPTIMLYGGLALGAYLLIRMVETK